MTEKLYYKDAYISEFTAEILEIATVDNRKAIVLDKTAFFPEGGGQPSDEGFIENTFISDVLEIDGYGNVMAQSLIDFLSNPQNIELINKFKEIIAK